MDEEPTPVASAPLTVVPAPSETVVARLTVRQWLENILEGKKFINFSLLCISRRGVIFHYIGVHRSSNQSNRRDVGLS